MKKIETVVRTVAEIEKIYECKIVIPRINDINYMEYLVVMNQQKEITGNKKALKQRAFVLNWCKRRDLNPHEQMFIAPSKQRVCHSTTLA